MEVFDRDLTFFYPLDLTLESHRPYRSSRDRDSCCTLKSIIEHGSLSSQEKSEKDSTAKHKEEKGEKESSFKRLPSCFQEDPDGEEEEKSAETQVLKARVIRNYM
ncbi:unnamed protein product [Thlaspi arvense]|uniref:Uncharacterized protein n=1 Tax=Thlaspi arvense TaxID=13288 RepID=A0AAU9RGE4_THLAR|nr:unnamed protein product [Thlaspi arvense]